MEKEYEFNDPISFTLKERFGLDYLFPYQRLVIGNILEAAEASGIPVGWGEKDASFGDAGREEEEGGDTERSAMGRQIVILPTGAGKSLCFQLPAMLLGGVTLVIYPILSLMADQERRLLEKNFAPVLLRGGQSESEREEIWRKTESGESRFIIANPEVLLTDKVLKALPRLGIAHIVIDEAHCVSEWGESFRPSYLEIGKIIKASKAPIVTAFTATASEPVLEKIEKYIFSAEDENACGAHRIIGNPDRTNISYSAQGCVLRDAAVRDILKNNKKPAIVFCSSRVGTEKLARYLRNYFETDQIRFYHAGLEREEKTEVEKWFFTSKDGVLVATCAYGMGVDKSNIRTVIHRDFPPSVEAYLQESGRAGRDGAFSRAFLLWGPDDELALKRAKTTADKERLEALFAFARDTSHCRREALLKLLNWTGENPKPSLKEECCDVCAAGGVADLREKESLLDFIRRNKRSFNIDEAAAIISELADISKAEARAALKYFVSKNILKETKRFPWRGTLTARSSGDKLKTISDKF